MNNMTITDLLEMLQYQVKQGNGSMPVHIAYHSGDHWRTTVVPFADDADMLNITYSGYHDKHILTGDDGEEQTEDSTLAFVIT